MKSIVIISLHLHHICVTWENSAGSWKIYKDGKVAASGKGINTGIFLPCD